MISQSFNWLIIWLINCQISRRMFPNHYDRDKLDEVELHNKLRHYIVNEVISLQTNKGMVLVSWPHFYFHPTSLPG